MLDLTHLRSFVAVATELHFGRAARRLNMTQPPLSRQIRLLEEELGLRLLERTSHAVALTPAGRVFLPEARALLGAAEEAAQVARRAAARPGAGTLTIGFIGAATYDFLPRTVTAAREALPATALTLREMPSRAQVDALLLGELDLALVRPVGPAPGLQSALVMREDLALALPQDHRLASRTRIGLAALKGESFIGYSPDGPYMRALLSDAFRATGIQPRVVQAMAHAQAILSLVSAGMGVAIVPAGAQRACFSNVVFRPIRLPSGAIVELHAMWRLEDRNPVLPAVRSLMLRNFGRK